MRRPNAAIVDRSAPTEAPPSAVRSRALLAPPSVGNRTAVTEAPPQSQSQSDSSRPTDVPSAHPTSVPDFDLTRLAETGPDFGPGGDDLFAELTVPARTDAPPSFDIELRAAFLLLHVDGVSTLSQIAKSARLPLAEVVRCFLDLVELGAVELGTPTAPAESGVFACVREPKAKTA